MTSSAIVSDFSIPFVRLGCREGRLVDMSGIGTHEVDDPAFGVLTTENSIRECL